METENTHVQEGDHVIHDEQYGTVKIVRDLHGHHPKILYRGDKKFRGDKESWHHGTEALHEAFSLMGFRLNPIFRNFRITTYEVTRGGPCGLFLLKKE